MSLIITRAHDKCDRMSQANSQHPSFHEITGYQARPDEQIAAAAEQFHQSMCQRRSIRFFSDRRVPRAAIESCVLAAGRAPSGANQQPWHFAIVESAEIKHQIRKAAEAEEREFYHRRAPQTWLDALAPLGTDDQKPFLETASHLIVVFTQTHSENSAGEQQKHYYASESVGIATGFLIAALHQAGLVTLTHTPSPMAFLNQILGRPKSERPFLLLVVGFPADDATVPAIEKKSLAEIADWH